jgi:hypothetical protein
VILLQYQLHKLFVLTIYYSVRGIGMNSNKTSHEATEVLAAARGALQIQRKGMGVWSNWDLVVRFAHDQTGRLGRGALIVRSFHLLL